MPTTPDVIIIHPDGRIEPRDTIDPWAVADEVIDGPRTVVSLRSPLVDEYVAEELTLVAFVGDFSAVDGSPLNAKAWALYGRSPIYGVAVVAVDRPEEGPRPGVPDRLVEVITEPLHNWLDAKVIARMEELVGQRVTP